MGGLDIGGSVVANGLGVPVGVGQVFSEIAIAFRK